VSPGRHRRSWPGTAGACLAVVAASCASASSPPRPQAAPSPPVPRGALVGTPSCTAESHRAAGTFTVAVGSLQAGDLVVAVSAPWTVFREDDPTFDRVATVEFPDVAAATVAVTLTVDGVSGPCLFSDFPAATVPAAAPHGAPRLLFIGDSLTAQSATALTDTFSREGAVTMVAGVSGSGLLSGYDWLPAAATIVAGFRPTFAVAEFIGNYPDPGVLGPSGAALVAGSDGFVVAWLGRAGQLTAELRSTGAHLGWVISPPMASTAVDAVADRLSAAYTFLVGRVPDGYTIDEQTPFANAQHNFTASHAQDGAGMIVRAADGVHLTDAGCQLWSQVMVRALRPLGAV